MILPHSNQSGVPEGSRYTSRESTDNESMMTSAAFSDYGVDIARLLPCAGKGGTVE